MKNPFKLASLVVVMLAVLQASLCATEASDSYKEPDNHWWRDIARHRYNFSEAQCYATEAYRAAKDSANRITLFCTTLLTDSSDVVVARILKFSLSDCTSKYLGFLENFSFPTPMGVPGPPDLEFLGAAGSYMTNERWGEHMLAETQFECIRSCMKEIAASDSLANRVVDAFIEYYGLLKEAASLYWMLTDTESQFRQRVDELRKTKLKLDSKLEILID